MTTYESRMWWRSIIQALGRLRKEPRSSKPSWAKYWHSISKNQTETYGTVLFHKHTTGK
jgi:hypothetical protein